MSAVSPTAFVLSTSAPRDRNSSIIARSPRHAAIISPVPMRSARVSGCRPARSQARACSTSPSSMRLPNVVGSGRCASAAVPASARTTAISLIKCISAMSLLLGRALALSGMLHAFALAYLGTRMPQPAPARKAVADLSVLLREERLPEPPPVRIEPQDAKPPARPPRVEVRPAKKTPVKKTPAKKKEPAPLRPLYPLEAIARGLEGDVMVRVMLDDRGNVIASQVYASSGHALLDQAALQAVGGLRGLPDNLPRETLLPVRFRLR